MLLVSFVLDLTTELARPRRRPSLAAGGRTSAPTGRTTRTVGAGLHRFAGVQMKSDDRHAEGGGLDSKPFFARSKDHKRNPDRRCLLRVGVGAASRANQRLPVATWSVVSPPRPTPRTLDPLDTSWRKLEAPRPARARWLNRPKSFRRSAAPCAAARCSDALCPPPARRGSISWPGAATRASTGAPRRARMCTSFCSSRCVPAGQAALGAGAGRWRQFSLALGASDDERRSCPHLVKGNVSVWKTQEHA